jgi:hypothetical protein
MPVAKTRVSSGRAPADYVKPAATGGDRRRPAATGGDRRPLRAVLSSNLEQ